VDWLHDYGVIILPSKVRLALDTKREAAARILFHSFLACALCIGVWKEPILDCCCSTQGTCKQINFTCKEKRAT
jgi:hypothetical protein